MSVDWQLPTTLPPVDLIPSADLWECLHLHVHTHIHMHNKKPLKSQYLSPVDQKRTNSYLGHCLIETELALLSQCHVCTSGRFICLPFHVAQVVNCADRGLMRTSQSDRQWSRVPFRPSPFPSCGNILDDLVLSGRRGRILLGQHTALMTPARVLDSVMEFTEDFRYYGIDNIQNLS